MKVQDRIIGKQFVALKSLTFLTIAIFIYSFMYSNNLNLVS